MFIDEVKISVTAGKGGRGTVAFSKTKMNLGPTGGSGGNGGNVIIEGISDFNALNQYRFRKIFNAEDGQNGMPQLHDGKTGQDLILSVPLGTVVHNLNTGADIEILKAGQRETVAIGGFGGEGNYLFRSSTNTSPKEFKEGTAGESFELRLELKLIADIGFVGLPNVGKSSLLNELTRANIKVANYPFTTLEPNLGVYYDLILADLPGLIEGASQGKGLGIKFLRHVERTRILFHFIAADSADPISDYKTVRAELGAYNKLLLEKPEYVFVTKSDLVAPEALAGMIAKLKKMNDNVTSVSIFDWDSMERLKRILNSLNPQKTE